MLDTETVASCRGTTVCFTFNLQGVWILAALSLPTIYFTFSGFLGENYLSPTESEVLASLNQARQTRHSFPKM